MRAIVLSPSLPLSVVTAEFIVQAADYNQTISEPLYPMYHNLRLLGRKVEMESVKLFISKHLNISLDCAFRVLAAAFHNSLKIVQSASSGTKSAVARTKATSWQTINQDWPSCQVYTALH